MEKLSASPDFWNDPQEARKTLKEKKRLQSEIERWREENGKLEDARILLELTQEEEDPELLEEAYQKLSTLEKDIEDMEFKRMLSGENDINNAFVTIQSGEGGTEAQDWSEMLLRMYLRWAERKGYRTQITDILPGQEAGIKSITFMVEGDYAYGLLRAEVGIHRLVRLSPFDTGKRRHTSFASVFVIPEVDEEIVIEIDEAELRIDTYRSSGAGGQHVNKTDSAVRITHLPTGIVVQCQNERSQHKNKAMALRILRSRLYEEQEKKKRESKEEAHRNKKPIGFGSQIRSYVLHPYHMVKDHRTQLEQGNVEAILDGELDQFVQTYLLSH